jgi:hypothetical protein
LNRKCIPGPDPQDSREIEKQASASVPSTPEKPGDHGARGSAGGIDPVEAALAKALSDASSAGAWDVVAQLARELEARRTARAGNVVDLGSRRTGRK